MINIGFIFISGIALSLDILIIITSIRKGEPPEGTSHEFIHKIFYLEILAMIRLVLLLPQFVNSVSGKRLSYPKTMQFIITMTMVLALGHVIVIWALRGLEDLKYLSLETDEEEDEDNEDMGMVWAAVLLTVISCVCHRMCLRLLRTTAPPINGKYLTKAGSKHASRRLAYHYRKILCESSAASGSMSMNVSGDGEVRLIVNGADEAAGGAVGKGIGEIVNVHKIEREWNQNQSSRSYQNEIEVPLLSPTSYSTPDGSETESVGQNDLFIPGHFKGSLNEEHFSILDRLKLQLQQMQQSNTCQPRDQFGCFPDEGNEKKNEFLSELISRVEEARQNWIVKLNEVSERFHLPVTVRVANYYGPPNSVFRLLLDLFVYEGNPLPKLEKHWEPPEDKQAQEDLIFFIPQLCTFLIYGAFLNSHELESFLLDKCKRNLRFAQRVYWFLLSWSLELSHFKLLSLKKKSVTRTLSRGHGSDGDIVHSPNRQKGHRRIHSSGNEKNRKFLPEDYQMIVSLAHKVQLCGEEAARSVLQRQNSHGIQFAIPPFIKQNAASYAPLCDGFPSSSHLETIIADEVVGVWDVERLKSSLLNTDRTIPVNFYSTPEFFDNLTRIADDLFFVEPEKRTEILREKLELLETRLLPNNAIYVPFSNRDHVVWRIVHQESFAISTKERVPCIVTLECIYLSDEDESNDELLSWYKTPRHPQRHNTIFQNLQEKGRAALKGVIKLRRSTSGLDLAMGDDDSDYEDDMEANESMSEAIGQWGKMPPHESGPGLTRRRTELPDNSIRSYGSNGESPPQLVQSSSNLSLSRPPLAPTRRTTKPVVVFKEDWSEKEDRIRRSSCFGNHAGWHLLPVFVKSNDDLRQEQLASQLIRRMSTILAKAKIPAWLYPYQIIALSDRGGIIEAVPNTISISSLKRNYPNWIDLPTFFKDHFCDDADHLAGAKANFVESIAAYSIVCYLLQVKDRHNGNILLTSQGHIVHIDFGFFFLSSPGKNTGFESAPFKLTSEYVDIMGGPSSKTFARFRSLCVKTFMELRKNCHQITLLVDMLSAGNEDLPCFRGRPDDAISELRDRFKLEMNDVACQDYVNGLINESLENWRTTCYDRYQFCCVGVL